MKNNFTSDDLICIEIKIIKQYNMKDIICPHCKMAFHVDESTYQTIVSQVRNHVFEEELQAREEGIKEQLKSLENANLLKTEKEYEKKISAKDKDIDELKNNITELKGIIAGYDAQKTAEIQTLKAQNTKELADALSEKNQKIAELENEISTKESNHKLELLKSQNDGKEDLQNKEKEIIELKAQLNNEKLSAENRENELKKYHLLQLEDKQAEIERLRDFKLRQSTKMVGESLEQHCSILFSQAQSLGLYPDASFEKDNVAVEGTKGDFIFRDYIGEDEYISVMFEMKNEMDTTATKHHNDDFLEKLHKDRTKKGCEYAVLVSMLEQGNELYDNGIVDKSHKYPKMLVIRPQFFMPVLRLLTEGARKGFNERRNLIVELEKARNESLDLSRFQEKLDNVKNSLQSNFEAAHKKFVDATEGIDKTIQALEKQIENLKKIKASFEGSDSKLGNMVKIGEKELTFRRLTYNNPTVRKMIEDADNTNAASS